MKSVHVNVYVLQILKYFSTMYHEAIVSTNFNIGFVKRKSMTVLLTNEHKNSKKKKKEAVTAAKG